MITRFIYTGISIIIALSLHELAHGFMSYKLGDPTPKYQGRLSLNPLNHLDPVGTICLFFFHFGWAKPVQINGNYYKNQKVGTTLVALAGPAMNFILATISMLLLKFLSGTPIINELLSQMIITNVGLCVFNLIPIPPLDGSKVLANFLPYDLYYKYMRIEQYGFIILTIILSTGILNPLLSTLNGILINIMRIITLY